MGKPITILPSWSLHSSGRDSWDLDLIWGAGEGFLEEVATEPRTTRGESNTGKSVPGRGIACAKALR